MTRDNEWLWFDLDGTIVDFYGVEGWLDYLIHGSTVPCDGILFDDEVMNRAQWNGASVDAVIMMEVLKSLIKYHV